MVKISGLAATILAMSAAPAAAFAPAPTAKASTELHMSNNGVAKAIGSSMVAASIMFTTIITPDAAIAATDFDADFGPTSSLIAGRSGGRAGGRSSASTMRSAPPPSRPTQSTTTINRTTVIQAPAAATPVIVAPPPVVVGSPLGYSPFAPSPLGIGLGIAGEVGREMREFRQEDQIRQARMDAQSAKEREFALEQRLNNMEMQQNAQNAANAAAAAAAAAAR